MTIFAAQALGAGIDHLNAWRLLVNGPEVPFLAHLTLLRGALKGAARCRWHVDATVDSGIRVGRGFAARRDDQEERRKFETSRERGARSPQTAHGLSAVIVSASEPVAIALTSVTVNAIRTALAELAAYRSGPPSGRP